MPAPRRKVAKKSPGFRPDATRTGLDAACLEQAILNQLYFAQGRLPGIATRNDWYMALSYAVRDRLLERWIRTVQALGRHETRVVAYLSAEFLTGPQLGINLINLGIEEAVREAVANLGLDFDEILAQEEEPGLGNGGLGRLAACYMDSLATLQIPAVGYGIRYEFGIFDQEIRSGRQVEVTDKWLHLGNPWEIARPELATYVKLGGHTEWFTDHEGRRRIRWIPHRVVKGIPHDTPVSGYRVNTVDLLRLWSAEACESFDFAAFNVGDYLGAVDQKLFSENISKVLYPNDEAPQGKQLRLEQQYFFASSSLQDMMRMLLLQGDPPESFGEAFAVQLNDTHPSVAVAELMRLLVDEYLVPWEKAWEVTRKAFSYTNHTLLPEALERWPLPLFAALLPRPLEIIFEINRRFLDQVRERFPGDDARVARMSLIDERGEKSIRMANLAVVGSHAVNGVAALHTELLQRTVLRDFAEIYPERFLNVTNGVTPRRFVVLSNPRLTRLISGRIGEEWVRHAADELPRLEPLVEDAGFRDEWQGVKAANKRDLAALLKRRTGVVVDPESMFDVQVKRIHEYKRQHLNVMNVIHTYLRLKEDPRLELAPRTLIFGGKAAPGYAMAKLIIRLIHGVADVVNSDPAMKGRLAVAFFPDFNVTNAQRIYPAADLSEQISTAGKEASGTGNMKFALNGALTIGTLDGANVEILEAVGEENFFLFGLTEGEVADRKARGYSPWDIYRQDPALREVVDLIGGGFLSGGDSSVFRPLVDSLLGRDDYLVLVDFASYVAEQEKVGRAFADPGRWTRMSILNAARVGRFSSDRSIADYCEKIWNVSPVEVTLE